MVFTIGWQQYISCQDTQCKKETHQQRPEQQDEEADNGLVGLLRQDPDEMDNTILLYGDGGDDRNYARFQDTALYHPYQQATTCHTYP